MVGDEGRDDGVQRQPRLPAPRLGFEVGEPDCKTLASNAFRSCSEGFADVLAVLLDPGPPRLTAEVDVGHSGTVLVEASHH